MRADVKQLIFPVFGSCFEREVLTTSHKYADFDEVKLDCYNSMQYPLVRYMTCEGWHDVVCKLIRSKVIIHSVLDLREDVAVIGSFV